MQVMPNSPFLPSLLHQQFLARGLASVPPPDPATPPSSEDNMSPPPRAEPPASGRSLEEESFSEKQANNYDRERARDFKCPLCSENMTSLKEFTAHLRSHNEVKPSPDPSDPTGQAKVYHCCLCGKMLSSFSSLDRHMLVHSGERPFSCEVCAQTFTTNGNMHRHRRTHNIRDSCESDGSAGSGGKKARKRKAPSLAPATAEKLPLKSVSEVAEESAYPLIKCPVCREKFFTELSLEVHVISMHSGKEIKCEDCGHPCPTFNYFKLHQNMFHFKLGPPGGFQAGAPPPVFSTNLSLLMAAQDKGLPPAGPLANPALHVSPVKRMDEELEHKDSSLLLPADTHNNSFCSDSGQDDDPILREMKLKGEFPCRLCPSVFPNLRALKGHNKEHLLAPPFECNVGTCRYSTGDKSNLLQHMRGHTGQKPFECKICNFGFTTKANCERHVKNKHNKNTKEEVRDHIIIHEGDDDSSTCPEGGKDLRQHAMMKPEVVGGQFERPEALSVPPTIFPPTPPQSSTFIPYRPFEVVDSKVGLAMPAVDCGDDAPLDLSKGSSARQSAGEEGIKVKSIYDLTANAKDNNNEAYPKKSPVKRESSSPVSLPSAAFPFTLPFLGGNPAAAAASLWPPQLGLNTMGPNGFPFNPMHLAALLAAKNETLKKQAEAIQSKEAAAALQNLSHIQDLASQRSLMSQISPTSSFSTGSPQNSPHKPSGVVSSESEASYKMIIKNGVLMRKQKQRRYRTERPYGCDKCNARFTLRSNMDRHVKQQHPETYNQKQRAAGRNKPASYAEESQVNGPPNAKEEDLELMRAHDEPKEAFDSEDEEEGFMDDEEEEEEDEQNLVIDDGHLTTSKPGDDGQTFNKISKFFDNPQFDAARNAAAAEKDNEACSESSATSATSDEKKKSAYSSAPHKMSCPVCSRKFPWSSSLNRHILTHTGEKPYKCTSCPLWFTTKSNCDRHILRKHTNSSNCDADDRDSGDDEACCDDDEDGGFHLGPEQRELAAGAGKKEQPGLLCAPDTPYKCHVCDDGFAERQAAIGHIEEAHNDEYKSLVSKGAFDCGPAAAEEAATVSAQPPPAATAVESGSGGEELYDQLRGKFPDYVNRKIVCLFCGHKFWSAEDLRRHVRTHTGERPYSCDICNRRFTLKHSMLRHKKKHDSGVSSGGDGSDDDTVSNHSSSGGRSSPEEGGGSGPMRPAQIYDKKRANLMEKISRLNSASDL